MDQPYFTNVDIIRDTDDVALLVNKYHRLPDDYEPQNLVKTPNACVIGEDFSCQSEPQYLRKEVADAFSELVKAGKAKHINMSRVRERNMRINTMPAQDRVSITAPLPWM